MKSLGLLLFVVYKFSNCGMELIFGASLKTTTKKKKKRDWKWILYVQFWPTYNNSAAEEPKTNEASRTLNYMKQNTALDKNQRGYSGNTDDVHLHV